MSGVSAIDGSDRAEHVFDPYWTLEVIRKFFVDKVWEIHPPKLGKNDLFWPFSCTNAADNVCMTGNYKKKRNALRKNFGGSLFDYMIVPKHPTKA